MSAREWAAARLVCRHWRAHVTVGVQVLELDLERVPHRWCMVGVSVKRLFPRLRSVALLVGTRVDAAAFGERMAELSFLIDPHGAGMDGRADGRARLLCQRGRAHGMRAWDGSGEQCWWGCGLGFAGVSEQAAAMEQRVQWMQESSGR